MQNYKTQPTPEEEKKEQELDELYPKARSKTVVEYRGEKYQIRYFPIEKTADGAKVKTWGHRWMLMKGK